MRTDNTYALRVSNLHAHYGDSHILHGVEFFAGPGEVVTLLGRNGSGRTTTLRAIMGLTGRRSGTIEIDGTNTAARAPHEIARLGIGYCPEERGIFSCLSTEENLLLPPVVAEGGLSPGEIYELFPNLRERRRSPGGRLSGGEQQMLALARILRTGSHTLLLDEITEGLAPVIVQALEAAIMELKKRRFTIVLAEQNFGFARRVADRHYVLEHGKTVLTVDAAEIERHRNELEARLGV